MNRKTFRFFQALLVALMLMSTFAGASFAQSRTGEDVEPVNVYLQDGWTASGRHAVADDFVIVCPPTKEVLDPSHPCSERNTAQVQFNTMDDLVLVCPVKEVLDPSHPCSERSTTHVHFDAADDFVLVCPIKEVLDPSHPCAEHNTATVRFEMPQDYVLVCPVKEVLDVRHPCADR